MSEATPLYESLFQDSTESQTPSSKIRASAAVIPWRRTNDRLEVYWVRRAATMPFMGGWWAFPGGGLSRQDAAVESALEPLLGQPSGCSSTSQTPASPGLDASSLGHLGGDLPPGLLVCALRELLEETGLWLSSALPDAVALLAARKQLLDKDVSFGDLPAQLDLGGQKLESDRLVFAGRWLTPPFVPTRFDNRFFLLSWPSQLAIQPSLEGRELDRGEWIEPGRALERWRAGEVMAAPPILHILRVLAEGGPEDGLERLRDTREADLGPLRKIEFLPGLVLLPLRTPTLPPATHTNAFLLGTERTVLIDPAAWATDEQEHLLAALEAAEAEGQKLEAIWLSHHHQDHIGAAEVVRRRFGVPVLAHPLSVEPLAARGLAVDGTLVDGQRVELGLESGAGLTVTIHHTPGHTQGHLCFELTELRALIACDLVSTLSTIVIDPPDGDMSDYLTSLEKMAALKLRTLMPSHGPMSLDPVGLLGNVLRHRLEREAKVLKAYRRGLESPAAMVAEVYAEVPPFLHPVACRQIQAHLDRLDRLGELSPSRSSV